MKIYTEAGIRRYLARLLLSITRLSLVLSLCHQGRDTCNLPASRASNRPSLIYETRRPLMGCYTGGGRHTALPVAVRFQTFTSVLNEAASPFYVGQSALVLAMG